MEVDTDARRTARLKLLRKVEADANSSWTTRLKAVRSLEAHTDARRTRRLKPFRPVEVDASSSWTTRLQPVRSLEAHTDARRSSRLKPLRSLEDWTKLRPEFNAAALAGLSLVLLKNWCSRLLSVTRILTGELHCQSLAINAAR